MAQCARVCIPLPSQILQLHNKLLGLLYHIAAPEGKYTEVLAKVLRARFYRVTWMMLDKGLLIISFDQEPCVPPHEAIHHLIWGMLLDLIDTYSNVLLTLARLKWP